MEGCPNSSRRGDFGQGHCSYRPNSHNFPGPAHLHDLSTVDLYDEYMDDLTRLGTYIFLPTCMTRAELVRNHDLDAASLMAAYPPPSFSSSTSCAAAIRNNNISNGNRTQENTLILENPLESRVSVDFVWP
ncbi:hypothetical protein PIB30_063094 [Stylosanthes scabra]|uniref:Uncharacterized protein n=1 Tax=Stylosanthes scabra TaxID=79078 RepID=A0ABU6YLK8_9FABA|nr:hypothetical protein [Stylosanthes scabra]